MRRRLLFAAVVVALAVLVAPVAADAQRAGKVPRIGYLVPDAFRRLAAHVDKVLKGTKPADIPVEQPTKFEFLVNLRTARELGLTISPLVLLQADQVIE